MLHYTSEYFIMIFRARRLFDDILFCEKKERLTSTQVIIAYSKYVNLSSYVSPSKVSELFSFSGEIFSVIWPPSSLPSMTLIFHLKSLFLVSHLFEIILFLRLPLSKQQLHNDDSLVICLTNFTRIKYDK